VEPRQPGRRASGSQRSLDVIARGSISRPMKRRVVPEWRSATSEVAERGGGR